MCIRDRPSGHGLVEARSYGNLNIIFDFFIIQKIKPSMHTVRKVFMVILKGVEYFCNMVQLCQHVLGFFNKTRIVHKVLDLFGIEMSPLSMMVLYNS